MQIAAPTGFSLYRFAVIVVVLAAFVAYVAASWNWPLLWDTQVMHYISFLIDRGWAPYRQILDMNMPGAYLFEHGALSIFGSSDYGWRLYDYTLAVAMTAAMISVARRFDWMAGLLGGALFTFQHAMEGPRQAGQRDQVLAVLQMAGYAAFFEAVRRRKPWLLFFLGATLTFATSIKPLAGLLGPALLVMLAWRLRGEGVAFRPYFLWAVAGFSVASAVVLSFLLVHGSLQAFYVDLTEVLPHYATLTQTTAAEMLHLTLDRPLVIFVLFAAVIAGLRRGRQNWEEVTLLLGVVSGLFMFYAQRKGFTQHRYAMEAFLLLWSSVQLFRGLREKGSVRVLSAAALLFAMIYVIPRDIHWVRRAAPYDNYSRYLEADLTRLGPDRLQNQVQCLDIVDGCLGALYHLKIVQNTGSTGDLLLFLPRSAQAAEDARKRFWSSLQSSPPAVYVLSNLQFSNPVRTFDKIDTWPAFADYLRSNYILVQQREFHDLDDPTSHPGANPDTQAYRIYVRRDSPLASPR